jgi:gamma-glutamylcyclotransferase (GGCT)/AIG2-like uncharacterized protein YtfP
MAHRCPESLPICPITLDGWELEFNRVANIAPAKDLFACVQGAIYYVSENDIEALDRCERLYERVYLRIAQGLEAYTYIMQEEYRTGERPERHYLDIIHKGYRQWELDRCTLEAAYWQSGRGNLSNLKQEVRI